MGRPIPLTYSRSDLPSVVNDTVAARTDERFVDKIVKERQVDLAWRNHKGEVSNDNGIDMTNPALAVALQNAGIRA